MKGGSRDGEEDGRNKREDRSGGRRGWKEQGAGYEKSRLREVEKRRF